MFFFVYSNARKNKYEKYKFNRRQVSTFDDICNFVPTFLFSFLRTRDN